MAVVAIIAFMNQGNIESVTGSFLFSKKGSYERENCVYSNSRPCYQLKGFGDNNAINPKAGEKIFDECINNKKHYSGEYMTQTNLCSQKTLDIKYEKKTISLPYEEKYEFCNQGKNFYIVKFEGNCIPPSTHQYLIVLGMLPISGPVGTQVAISGSGFTPEYNYIIMNNIITGPTWIPTPFSSPDGERLIFKIPNETVLHFCPPKDIFPNIGCSSLSPETIAIIPGQYHIAVFNTNGVGWADSFSNLAPFTDIFTVT